LAKLRQGVKAWNIWREENPNTIPHLNGADLSKVNLQGAFLATANLEEASFEKAILWRANLARTNLYKTNLEKAILWRTDLERANLSEAKLLEAVLWRVRLVGASNLSVGQLSQVKTLHEAELDEEIRAQIERECPHILQKPKRS